MLSKIAKHFIWANKNCPKACKTLLARLGLQKKTKSLKLMNMKSIVPFSSLFKQVLKSKSVIRLLIPSPITDEEAVKRTALNQLHIPRQILYNVQYSAAEICSICLQKKHQKVPHSSFAFYRAAKAGTLRQFISSWIYSFINIHPPHMSHTHTHDLSEREILLF